MTLSLSLQMYETPLFLAALDGREKAVALLLDNGALVNITDSELNSPLHAAAKGGHVGVAALLLERGANPNQPNEVRVRGGGRACRVPARVRRVLLKASTQQDAAVMDAPLIPLSPRPLCALLALSSPRIDVYVR